MFAKPLREKKCVTMLDPIHTKYGKVAVIGLCFFSLIADAAWIPVILIGLGTADT